ncbi:hypothetical protein [Lederbergia galactosidilytica]|uniref:hypothetical protein n=1 Tax=Lederbergia galactosidilytica TaxID=217031 RepID=UPI0007DAF8E2|nr:hypothetical protein [Lederbergia galactosidilytica]MBP1916526.1 hypothetical protein [Lederbergia galactosidilytica]
MIKITTQIITFLGFIFLISGCTTEGQASPDDTLHTETEIDSPKQSEEKPDSEPKAKENSSQTEMQDNGELTEEEVLAEIKKQIDTKLTIVLPDSIPLDEGEHLTAATTSEDDRYTVTFFASQDPIPINNKQLNDSEAARKIASLTVQEYSTQEQADEEIAYEDFKENGGNKVDLGYEMTGYQDAGAGSLWTGWNEGRWALTTHTYTDEADSGEKLARNTVKFLENHSLPIPEEHGFVHLDATGNDQQIVWQKEKVVYQLDQIADSIIGLKIATSFE